MAKQIEKNVSVSRSNAAQTSAITRKANKIAKAAVNQANECPFVIVFYAHLLFRALMGEFGPSIRGFYVRAIAYHKKQNTVFPRPRNADVELLDHASAIAYLIAHKEKGLLAGSAVSQRLFDQMMVDTIKAKAKGIRFQ